MAIHAWSFDWSAWDRESIANMVRLVKDDVVQKPLSLTQFHNIITKHIKKWMPIRSHKSQEPQVTPTYVFVGGFYCTDYDEEYQKSIELCFAYSTEDEVLCLSTQRFNRLCNRIADVVLHEVIHMRQARKRKFKSLPGYSSTVENTVQRVEQEYLGHPDEIDAYAFNMACELNERFKGDINQIVDYLNQEQRGKRRNYDTWRTYLKAFDYNQNHKIIRKIKKRSIYYLSRAQISKPFQTKDWIYR